jgi:hypothetical protein
MLRVLAIVIGVAVPLAASQAKTDPVALASARSWLSTVERGDREALVKITSLPFTYATTNKVKECEGTVTDQKGLSRWMTCIRKSDAILLTEIREGVLRPSDPPNAESKALKRLAAKIRRTGTWIEAYINGDGITFTFRFLVVEGAVAAFLVETDFDAG